MSEELLLAIRTKANIEEIEALLAELEFGQNSDLKRARGRGRDRARPNP